MTETTHNEKQKMPKWLLLLWVAFLVFIVAYVLINL